MILIDFVLTNCFDKWKIFLHTYQWYATILHFSGFEFTFIFCHSNNAESDALRKQKVEYFSEYSFRADNFSKQWSHMSNGNVWSPGWFIDETYVMASFSPNWKTELPSVEIVSAKGVKSNSLNGPDTGNILYVMSVQIWKILFMHCARYCWSLQLYIVALANQIMLRLFWVL